MTSSGTSTTTAYAQQHRGDAGAYERYLLGMDASMRQKVALTAAFLLGEGRVADMGMGSGAGSEALASLYPSLDVVGVDVSETMVRLASDKHRRPNLRFVIGDIGQRVFPPRSLDGIFDSSVLHHVTSFSGYDRGAAARALEVQLEALKDHGVLLVRDFVDPGPGTVLLDLPDSDGESEPLSGSPNVEALSTAALFERFAREFRPTAASPGFRYERADDTGPTPLRPGFRRYRVSRTHAAEFLLRKDYRADWASELLEEYTYMTQPEFEALFARLGLRVLASVPLVNPWIVRHRLEGRVALHEVDGTPAEWLPTNYVIVGERVPEGEGVRFDEEEAEAPVGFLELRAFRHRVTGEGRDLVRRPHRTVDVVPFFETERALYVLARGSYPRPILASRAASPFLDGATPPHYVTEPLTLLQGDAPLGLTVENALARWANVSPDAVRSLRPGLRYFPSPGGLLEEVQSAWVEIPELLAFTPSAFASGFRTSGRLRAIEATQVLRAAQVGGLPDARLEQNVYSLLLARGRAVGPWIGESLDVLDGEAPRARVTVEELLSAAPRRRFVPIPKEASPGFLELRCARFVERDAAGHVVAARPLELVVPRLRSTNTVACAVVRRHRGEILLGVDEDDLPAAQCFDGSSALVVAPAWRLPRGLRGMRSARSFVAERLAAEHGVTTHAMGELGGRYHPSSGTTPEVVFPMIVVVASEAAAPRPLTWVPLTDAVARHAELTDGHLRVVLLRAAHALGLLP